MELVSNIEGAVTKLAEKLEMAIEDELKVIAHFNVKGFMFRTMIEVEEYEITEEGIYIEGGWTTVNSGNFKITNIEFDEESVHIIFDGEIEVYLELK